MIVVRSKRVMTAADLAVGAAPRSGENIRSSGKKRWRFASPDRNADESS